MKKYFFYTTIALAAFASCKNEPYKEEVEEIGRLRVKLVQTDSILKTVDAEDAERLGTEVRNNSQFIQFNLRKVGDTLDYPSALLLTNYQALLRGFETVDETHKKITMAIDSVEHSLDNLEHDLRNNSLAQGLSPEECVEEESEQVKELNDRSKELQPLFVNTKASYDTLAPKIRDYMGKLNQRLSEKQAEPNKK